MYAGTYVVVTRPWKSKSTRASSINMHESFELFERLDSEGVAAHFFPLWLSLVLQLIHR